MAKSKLSRDRGVWKRFRRPFKIRLSVTKPHRAAIFYGINQRIGICLAFIKVITAFLFSKLTSAFFHAFYAFQKTGYAFHAAATGHAIDVEGNSLYLYFLSFT